MKKSIEHNFILDQSGKVRIWDTVNKEHILKNEFHPIGGPIKDIAWSADSQRMVVVGEGRERYTCSLECVEEVRYAIEEGLR